MTPPKPLPALSALPSAPRKFKTIRSFLEQLTLEYGDGSSLKGFLVPQQLIAAGAGVRFSYAPQFGVGTADVLRPFAGALIILYSGRYDSPDLINQISKKNSITENRYMVRVVLEGNMTMRFGQKIKQVPKGHGLVYSYPDARDTDLWSKAHQSHRYVHIIFSDEGLDNISRLLDIATPAAFLALSNSDQPEDKAGLSIDGPALEHFAESLWLQQGPDHLRAKLLQLKVGELFCLLSGETDILSMNAGHHLPRTDLRKLVEIQTLLDSVYVSPPSLSTLSVKSGLNRRKLTEGFRALTGTSIGDYCQNKRVARAVDLLETTSKSIAEIAAECGYEHVGNFSRTFKKRLNCSPSDLRRNY